MSNDLKRRRDIHALGQRAIDYYLDTGFCVFCVADDVGGVPHEDHCNVGKLSGVENTPERAAEKLRQRKLVHLMMFGSKEEDT